MKSIRYKIFIAIATIAILNIISKPEFLVPDSAGYYGYLRSIINDFDIHFGNEFREWNVQPVWNHLSETGYIINMFSVGPAILWLPFYFIGSLLTRTANLFGNNLSNDGYSDLYLLSIHYGTVFWGVCSLILIYLTCKLFFDDKISKLVPFLVLFGTPFYYYFFFHSLFSHVPTAFGTALFLYYFLKSKDDKNQSKWVNLGLLGGFISLIRWQESLFMLIVLFKLIDDLRQDKDWIRLFKRVSLVFSAFIIAFSPQMVAWYVIYGSPFTIPQGSENIQFFQFNILNLLFSSHHGLFFWTPIYIFVFIGFYFLIKGDKFLGISLLVIFIIQLYINSIHHWQGGWSFGVRRICDCSVISALCLGSFISGLKEKRVISKRIIIGLFVFCVIWTLFLSFQMNFNLIDPESYSSFSRLLENQLMVLKNLPKIAYIFIFESPIMSQRVNFPAPFILSLIILIFSILFYQLIQKKILISHQFYFGLGIYFVLWTGVLLISALKTDPVKLQTPEERSLLENINEKGKTLLNQQNNKELLKGLALDSYRLKLYNKSCFYLEKAYSLDKGDLKLAKDLLICYLQANDLEKAENLCKEILLTDMNNPEILNYEGLIYLERNDFKKALEIFKRISEKTLNNLPSFYVNLGRCYYQLDEDGKAKENFLKALEMDKSNILALRYLKILSGGGFSKAS